MSDARKARRLFCKITKIFYMLKTPLGQILLTRDIFSNGCDSQRQKNRKQKILLMKRDRKQTASQ